MSAAEIAVRTATQNHQKTHSEKCRSKKMVMILSLLLLVGAATCDAAHHQGLLRGETAPTLPAARPLNPFERELKAQGLDPRLYSPAHAATREPTWPRRDRVDPSECAKGCNLPDGWCAAVLPGSRATVVRKAANGAVAKDAAAARIVTCTCVLDEKTKGANYRGARIEKSCTTSTLFADEVQVKEAKEEDDVVEAEYEAVRNLPGRRRLLAEVKSGGAPPAPWKFCPTSGSGCAAACMTPTCPPAPRRCQEGTSLMLARDRKGCAKCEQCVDKTGAVVPTVG